MGARRANPGRKRLVRSKIAVRRNARRHRGRLRRPGPVAIPRHRPRAITGLLLPDYAVPCKHLAATFYLLAESFDEDPFAILAWRGREREDLLANLAAARADGAAPAADHAEQVAQPLTDCLDRYYARQADINVPSPPATPSTALLDQLPDTGLSARGRPLTELLRPAYHALTHHHNSAGG